MRLNRSDSDDERGSKSTEEADGSGGTSGSSAGERGARNGTGSVARSVKTRAGGPTLYRVPSTVRFTGVGSGGSETTDAGGGSTSGGPGESTGASGRSAPTGRSSVGGVPTGPVMFGGGGSTGGSGGTARSSTGGGPTGPVMTPGSGGSGRTDESEDEDSAGSTGTGEQDGTDAGGSADDSSGTTSGPGLSTGVRSIYSGPRESSDDDSGPGESSDDDSPGPDVHVGPPTGSTGPAFTSGDGEHATDMYTGSVTGGESTEGGPSLGTFGGSQEEGGYEDRRKNGGGSGSSDKNRGNDGPMFNMKFKGDPGNPKVTFYEELPIAEKGSGKLIDVEKDIPLSLGFVAKAGIEASASLTGRIQGEFEYKRDGTAMFPGSASGRSTIGLNSEATVEGTIGAGIGIQEAANMGLQGSLSAGIKLSGTLGPKLHVEFDGSGNVTRAKLALASVRVKSEVIGDLKAGPYIEIATETWTADWELMKYELLKGTLAFDLGVIEYLPKRNKVNFGGYDYLPNQTNLSINPPSEAELADPVTGLINWLGSKEDDVAREMIKELDEEGNLERMDPQRKAELIAKAHDMVNTDPTEKRIIDVLDSAESQYAARYILFEAYYKETGNHPKSGEELKEWVHGFVQNNFFWNFSNEWTMLTETVGGSDPENFAPWGFRNPYGEPMVENSIYTKHIEYYRSKGGMGVTDPGTERGPGFVTNPLAGSGSDAGSDSVPGRGHYSDSDSGSKSDSGSEPDSDPVRSHPRAPD